MPATAQVRIGADTKEFKRAMDGINGSLGKIGKNARGLSGILGGTLGMLKKIGAVSVFGGIPAGLLAAQKAFNKFEHNMLEVYTLLPRANRAFFQTMKKDALSFSEAYGRMPEEVAKGMYQAISAGSAPTGLTEGFLAVAQQSAIAGVTDMKTAVDALTNVTNSYGEGTYNVSQVADQMFTAVSMSKTTFRELADYMYQILPTAGSLNVRLDDLLGSISALAATGTLTRVGTTQLRQMLIEMSRIGDKSQQAFLRGTGGVPLEEFIKRGGRLVDVIKIMAKEAERRKVSIRNLFGSVEAGNAATTLANSKKFANMVSEIEGGSGGMMGRAFDKMSSSQKFKIDKIARTFMNSFIRVGEVIRPMIDDIITYFEGRAEAIQNFDWDGLARKFKDVWYKIKKLVQEGEMWEFFILNAKIAFKRVTVEFTKAIEYITSKLSYLFSAPRMTASMEGLKSALGGIVDAFWEKFVAGASGLRIALLDALAPVMAWFSAWWEQEKYNINPTNIIEKRDKIRNAKIAQVNRVFGADLKSAMDLQDARRAMSEDNRHEGGKFGGNKVGRRAFQQAQESVHYALAKIDTDSRNHWGLSQELTNKAIGVMSGRDMNMKPETDAGIRTYGEDATKLYNALVKLSDNPSLHRSDAVSIRKALVGINKMREERAISFYRVMSAGKLNHLKGYADRPIEPIDGSNVVFHEKYNDALNRHRREVNLLTQDFVNNNDERKASAEVQAQEAMKTLATAMEVMATELSKLELNNPTVESENMKRLRESIAFMEGKRNDMWNKYVRTLDDEEGTPDDGGNIVEDGNKIANNDYTMQAVQQVPMVADSKAKVGGGGGVWTGRYTPLDKNNDLLKKLGDTVEKNTDALKGRTNSVLDGVKNNPPPVDKNWFGETQSRANYRESMWLLKKSQDINDIIKGPDMKKGFGGLRGIHGMLFDREERFATTNPIVGELNPYNDGNASNPEFNPQSALKWYKSEFLNNISRAGESATGDKMSHQEVFAASDAEYLYVQNWNEMVTGFQKLYVEQMAAAKELRMGTEEYRKAQQEALKLYPRVTVDEVLNFQ